METVFYYPQKVNYSDVSGVRFSETVTVVRIILPQKMPFCRALQFLLAEFGCRLSVSWH